MIKNIGAHLSTSGGVYKAVQRAGVIGCNCLQVFSGSPRMWRRTPFDKIDVEKLFSEQEKLSVKSIYTHALYLINLASDKDELIQKSLVALKHDLHFDELVKGSGVVVHLGSHQGRGWESCKNQLVEMIVEVLNDTPDNSRLLIENSAGQNGKIASDLSEIRWLIDEVRAKLPEGKRFNSNNESRLGWCFDTCHGFAAGYYMGKNEPVMEGAMDLFANDSASSAKSSAAKKKKAHLFENRKSSLEEISNLKLWDDLICIHVNESRDLFASGRDRHDNLGEGTIGLDDLKHFLRDDRVVKIPLLMEVPGFEGKGPDEKNVEILKGLVK